MSECVCAITLPMSTKFAKGIAVGSALWPPYWILPKMVMKYKNLLLKNKKAVRAETLSVVLC